MWEIAFLGLNIVVLVLCVKLCADTMRMLNEVEELLFIIQHMDYRGCGNCGHDTPSTREGTE